jgi:hypothetical protein
MSGRLSSQQIDEQILALESRADSLTDEELQHLIDLKAAQFLTRLATGICTVCGGQVTKEVQVGRCVYAEPCGHRMRQGKARKELGK